MVFSSIVFLYIFLPILLITYFIVPSKFKNAVMIVASLIFFAWGEIRYIAIMLTLAIMDFICGNKIQKNPEKKKLYLWIDVGVNLLILFFFKYADFIIGNINALLHINLPLLNIPLPIRSIVQHLPKPIIHNRRIQRHSKMRKKLLQLPNLHTTIPTNNSRPNSEVRNRRRRAGSKKHKRR